ncbi:hypothetical protein [Chamaesiphon sp. OTE_20_metabat_361]|nr:hypothetical protein [Chamaesiphon sp. OTE_20_metabat_361]
MSAVNTIVRIARSITTNRASYLEFKVDCAGAIGLYPKLMQDNCFQK